MLNDIIDKALELEGEAREAYLDGACAGDPELREKANRLLADFSASVPSEFLQDPIPIPDVPDLPVFSQTNGKHVQPGHRIGEYRIVELIGRGGMGEVYLAERADGAFEQKVAIKLVKAGMSTDEVLRRFHYERQILANLEHPNIARLLNGGISDDGSPYFVMEYVEGIPITDYCDQNQLSVRERLKLFKTVCDAVKYAQRNLVVHRDLKPGNILVTEEGVVKLLDFGIAKLLEGDNDPITAFQTTGQLGPFTPAYAAPEQVTGKPINAATDVYALGVILYELLTGRRPYKLERGGGLLPENVRLICEKVPTVPSSIATRRYADDPAGLPTDLSTKRGVEPIRLKRLLQGDVDAIVMKALKKEPKWRYASAGELVFDLENYLANRPVSAQRGSMGYRGFKFVQRHKMPVVAFALAFITLIGGIVSTNMKAVEAKAAAEREREEANKALAVRDFISGTLQSVSPDQRFNTYEISTSEIMYEGLNRIASLQQTPTIQAALMNALAEIGQGFDLLDQADSLHRAALNIQRMHLASDDPDIIHSLNGIARVQQAKRQWEQAESTLTEAISLNSSISDSYVNLGVNYFRTSHWEKSESTWLTAMELDPENIRGASNLGTLYFVQEKYKEAEKWYRRAISIQPRSEVFNNLGNIYYYVYNDFQKTAQLFEEALEINPNDHRIHGYIGSAHYWLGNEGLANEHFHKAIAQAVEKLKQEDENDVDVLSSIAMYHAMLADTTSTINYLEKSLSASASVTSNLAFRVVFTFEQIGRRDEALEFTEKALQGSQELFRIDRGPGFQNLRLDPRFKTLKEKIQK